MRLSEAIRLGAMVHPQGLVVLYDGFRTCALGAALVALGQRPLDTGVPFLEDRFPFINDTATCPVCSVTSEVWRIASFHLNDDHQWTREHIADWVSGIEQRLEDAAEGRPDTRVDAEIGSLARS